jgi:hypothetical protein
MATSIPMQRMVQEAIRQRKAQRSISTLLWACGIGLAFVLPGLFLSLRGVWPIGLPLVAAGLIGGIQLGRKYQPRRPWGISRLERCPKCQQQHLREDNVTYEVPGATRRTIYRAMVVLCDEKCGFGIGYQWPGEPNLERPGQS